MAHMFTSLETYDFGKLVALQGPSEHTNRIMQSLMDKLTATSPVMVIDTNTAANLRYLPEDALKRILLATPYTAEELYNVVKKTEQAIEATDARVLLITSIDHLLYDPNLDPHDAAFLLHEIMNEITKLTELKDLITIIGLSNNKSSRALDIRKIIETKCHFLGEL
ncbi:MAG: hypothetical protein ACE5FT_06720 [Candidatus Nanoarchaeia archaeon]